MKVLFYRYGSICEPDMLNALKKAGLEVFEITDEILNKKITDAERISLVEQVIKPQDVVFVFSINFYPSISEICKLYNTLYLFWTVDSPVPELFSKSIMNPTNRAFLFDKAQYNAIEKYNHDLVNYLPLASAVERFDECIAGVTDEEQVKFSSDISFVGSLYIEKDPIARLEGLSDYTKGYLSALTEASLGIFGYYPVKDALNETVISDVMKAAGDRFYKNIASVTNIDSYVVSHSYMAYHIAAIERVRTINKLAEYFNVDLYTRSDISMLKGVNIKGGVKTLDEMPKVFNLSKINLNMTMRAIETGLPLRIFDIMGCGGFLMTNYQSELEEYFVIGKDLEAYSSIEELIDKCAYYLEHEDERKAIALNGYELVKNNHSYFHRLRSMLAAI